MNCASTGWFFYTRQKVNLYCDTAKLFDCKNSYIFITTTLGHFVCTSELVAKPFVTALAHAQSDRRFRARRPRPFWGCALLGWHCPQLADQRTCWQPSWGASIWNFLHGCTPEPVIKAGHVWGLRRPYVLHAAAGLVQLRSKWRLRGNVVF